MEKSTSLVSGASKSSAGNPLFVDSIKGNIKQKYHFKEKLANGGFGVVYLAEDRQTKELFAVKAIQQKKVKDYATFVNEINILRVLDHPHIIKLHEIWEWSDVCFLVLEYCRGGELFHYILEQKHLSEREAATIMKQLLSALMYLHKNNISHRDIKPENFMLYTKNDPTNVKMIDFGLSKDYSNLDTMSTMSGSPYYIAPEVFFQNYTQKIDIWSMGVVLYIMLSGKVPFPGNNEIEIIENVIKGDFHFNHEPFQRHSPKAKEFLLNLIQKDVSRRFTAEEAYNHPWIQSNDQQSSESMSPATFNELQSTLDMIKVRRVVLVYLTEKMTPNNFTDLQREFVQADSSGQGLLSPEIFAGCFERANMKLQPREFQELSLELGQQNLKQINYNDFLSAVFMGQMFFKELHLASVLKKMDTGGKGGLTIKQMKNLLQVHQDFQFPENALGVTLKTMLGADINQLDPNCIIDTEQFLASLRKEFSSIAQRSISQGQIKFKQQ